MKPSARLHEHAELPVVRAHGILDDHLLEAEHLGGFGRGDAEVGAGLLAAVGAGPERHHVEPDAGLEPPA